MEVLKLHGIILKSADYSEFDRRFTLLTAERGKITVFARAVKRPGNKLMASTEAFTFGTFLLTEGRNAYNLRDTEINNYFNEIRTDLSAFYTGAYFLEFADYYSRENMEDRPLLSLLYTSLLALLRDDFKNEFVKAVFEIKIIAIEGELPGLPGEMSLLPGTIHAFEHIISSPESSLFTFMVNDEVLKELIRLSGIFMRKCIRHDFASLKVMECVNSPL